MSYILKLTGWYPSKENTYTGDFVQRHARSIALYEKVVVVFAVKSTSVKKLTIETTTVNNLTEIICYYPKKKIADTLYSQYYYFKVLKKVIAPLFNTHGLPKLVHVNIAWKAGLWALYLKRKFNLPYIITENWTAYYPTDPNYVAHKKSRFGLLKKIFTKATYFVPVTKDLSQTCNALFKIDMPAIVVENAVDTGLFYPVTTNNTTLKIVHVSTMNYQKNTDGLLQAIAALPDLANVALYLIGPYSAEIEAMVNNHAVLKNITHFTGNIPYPAVAAHVREADVMVLYSRYENLPCVILEALCCGVPVIATNVGGIREVINEKNGILVKSEQEDTLKNAILQMLVTSKNYDRFAIAKDAMAKYSYEAMQLLTKKY
jgi:glycosyltransferase involved in cell wall biosynthesis